ncbi:MAG: hypothetical protein ACI8SJ_001452 [Shewanella sp.]|jgi:hypothetical protein
MSAPHSFSKAPIITVYSTSGKKWDRIDKTKISNFSINLNAECKFEGKDNKADKGKMSLSGFLLISDSA